MAQETKAIVANNSAGIMADYLSGKIEPKDYPEYEALGQAASSIKTLAQWVIGKLAMEVTEKWGRGQLLEFCRAIGFEGQTGTVNQYRWVIEGWTAKYGQLPDEVLRGENYLPFSYYRAVITTEKPQDWIDKAQDEHLTVNQLSKRIKGMPEPDKCKHSNPKVITICDDCGIKINNKE
jgi:hypothetical protein